MNRNAVSFLAAVLFSIACLAQNSADTPAAIALQSICGCAAGNHGAGRIDSSQSMPTKPSPATKSSRKSRKTLRRDNKVVLPKGSKVMGKVTQAQGRAKGQDESALGLAFDSAVLKDGTQVPISFTIQAVANSSAAMAQAALDAQGASTSISMANNAPGGGAGWPAWAWQSGARRRRSGSTRWQCGQHRFTRSIDSHQPGRDRPAWLHVASGTLITSRPQCPAGERHSIRAPGKRSVIRTAKF